MSRDIILQLIARKGASWAGAFALGVLVCRHNPEWFSSQAVTEILGVLAGSLLTASTGASIKVAKKQAVPPCPPSNP